MKWFWVEIVGKDMETGRSGWVEDVRIGKETVRSGFRLELSDLIKKLEEVLSD